MRRASAVTLRSPPVNRFLTVAQTVGGLTLLPLGQRVRSAVRAHVAVPGASAVWRGVSSRKPQ